ncbi:hypothetical protein C8Q74DRAFT_631281 [Fomes fomentarius]|nr:hypothetical protein C8Q74DRAFT_631281 [Fomes fomentarius]
MLLFSGLGYMLAIWSSSSGLTVKIGRWYLQGVPNTCVDLCHLILYITITQNLGVVVPSLQTRFLLRDVRFGEPWLIVVPKFRRRVDGTVEFAASTGGSEKERFIEVSRGRDLAILGVHFTQTWTHWPVVMVASFEWDSAPAP